MTLTLRFREPRQNGGSTKTGADVSTLLSCIQSHCRPQHCVIVILAEDKGTKSAIAGKQAISFGQNTTTGGLFQSSPCASPSKLIKLQERKKILQRKVETGTPVSLQHGHMCHSRTALQFQPPLLHQL